MSNSNLPTKPWRDLRWWILILPFVLMLCWLFLYFQQANMFIKLIEVTTSFIGGWGLRVLYEQDSRR